MTACINRGATFTVLATESISARNFSAFAGVDEGLSLSALAGIELAATPSSMAGNRSSGASSDWKLDSVTAPPPTFELTNTWHIALNGAVRSRLKVSACNRHLDASSRYMTV
jgi:hypothetical protein